jgi:hypothetical protein
MFVCLCEGRHVVGRGWVCYGSRVVGTKVAIRNNACIICGGPSDRPST